MRVQGIWFKNVMEENENMRMENGIYMGYRLSFEARTSPL